MQEEIQKIKLEIQDLEENLLKGKSKNKILKIHEATNKVLDIEKNLQAQKETLEYMSPEFTLLKGKLTNLKSTMEIYSSERIRVLNKSLTTCAILFLPQLLITTFFNMSTKFPNDLTNSPFALVYIATFMFFISILSLTFLHFKKYI